MNSLPAFIVFFLFISLATEALVELVVKSDFFKPLRVYFFNRRKLSKFHLFIYKITDCGYCFSVWVALFVLFFSISYIPYCAKNTLGFILSWLVVHRMSNGLHFIIDRLKGV